MLLTTHIKAIRHWTFFTVCSILLTVVLVACGGGGTANTPTPTPKPTPSPTPSAQTYMGDGFTIDYPSDWKTNTSTPGQASFANASSTEVLTIKVVDNPPSGQTADSIISAFLQSVQSQFTNFQQATDVPNSAMVGGDTWPQAGATYDTTLNGQAINAKVVVLADGHPANAPVKGFLIVYSAPTQMFDQANTNDFQPMLQSFMFTS